MRYKRRILIIDDNEHIVGALKSFLARKYENFTAYNGAEGLRRSTEARTAWVW